MQNMPPELAQQLLAQGALMIVAGCPTGTEFGIDLNAYKVDDGFRGVKMIPTGPHYVYTASQGLYGDSALRVGFLHYFKPQEVLIREWDADKEELRLRTKGNRELEHQRIRDNIKELDKFLAPYDFEALGKWKNLTDGITEAKILRTLPECGLVRTSAEFESCPDAERPKGGSDPNTAAAAIRQYNNKILQNEENMLPHLKVVAGTSLRFDALPDRCAPDATPAQVTSAFMDSIGAVRRLLDIFPTPDSLIEECQLSFILYLAGCSVDALAHWRKLLNLLANSETAVERNQAFYARYMDTIQHQLPELPDEMMPATAHNTVYKDVQRLVANCSTNGLTREAEYLAANLSSSMAWQFDDIFDEDPEDLPVVVEDVE